MSDRAPSALREVNESIKSIQFSTTRIVQKRTPAMALSLLAMPTVFLTRSIRRVCSWR